MSGPAAVPPHPECTYDEVPEPRQQAQDPPKSRYQRLESRLNELETLLREKERQSSEPQSSTPMSLGALMPDPQLHDVATVQRDAFGYLPYENAARHASEDRLDAFFTPRTSHYSPIPDHDALFRIPPSSLGGGFSDGCASRFTVSSGSPGRESDLMTDAFWLSTYPWPNRLPNPELLQHLYVLLLSCVALC